MSDPYEQLRTHFSNVEDVTVNAGTGSQGIKFGKKMFVMFHKGQLLVQLPPDRVSELIASGEALPHDPGTGKPMKDRVLVPDSASDKWIAFCDESLNYARTRS
jgi:hypothetical protein